MTRFDSVIDQALPISITATCCLVLIVMLLIIYHKLNKPKHIKKKTHRILKRPSSRVFPSGGHIYPASVSCAVQATVSHYAVYK